MTDSIMTDYLNALRARTDAAAALVDRFGEYRAKHGHAPWAPIDDRDPAVCAFAGKQLDAYACANSSVIAALCRVDGSAT